MEIPNCDIFPLFGNCVTMAQVVAQLAVMQKDPDSNLSKAEIINISKPFNEEM